MESLGRAILLWVFVGSVLGCSIVPVKPTLIRTPLPDKELAMKIQSYDSCPNPALPKDSSDPREWKYGCFCGQEHPPFKNEPKEEYYKIRPKDDIDEVCRDHDLCWLKYGIGDAQCTDEFNERIKYLNDSFTNLDKGQCRNITTDVVLGFLTPFVKNKHKTDKAKEYGSLFAKIVTLPVSIFGIGVHKGAESIKGHPERFEECNIESQKIKLEQE